MDLNKKTDFNIMWKISGNMPNKLMPNKEGGEMSTF